MSLSIISVGQKMPLWCNLASEEYLKRLQRFFKCQLIEVPTANRVKTPEVQRLKQQESVKILQHIAKDDWVIALEVKGQPFSTEKFATNLNQWLLQSKPVKFIIGGPDGLAENCIARADVQWSLSPLTFPHALARVIVLEQLYRAASLMESHPYHRK